MDIEVCIYIEKGAEITSSHRSSNGFVYSGYHYSKPIVYTSLPFNLSDEQKESIKRALCKYETKDDFEPDGASHSVGQSHIFTKKTPKSSSISLKRLT